MGTMKDTIGKIGKNVRIYENVKIGKDVTIGDYTILYDNVEIGDK